MSTSINQLMPMREPGRFTGVMNAKNNTFLPIEVFFIDDLIGLIIVFLPGSKLWPPITMTSNERFVLHCTDQQIDINFNLARKNFVIDRDEIEALIKLLEEVARNNKN